MNGKYKCERERERERRIERAVWGLTLFVPLDRSEQFLPFPQLQFLPLIIVDCLFEYFAT